MLGLFVLKIHYKLNIIFLVYPNYYLYLCIVITWYLPQYVVMGVIEFSEIVKKALRETERISKEQEKYLNENKGKLFEYYAQVSNPLIDSRILGKVQVWIYGDDRNSYTPHLHLMLSDRSREVEVSLIDFSLINIKSPKNISCVWSNFNDLRKPFEKWLCLTNKMGMKNIEKLFIAWDQNNPNNFLIDYVDKHKIKNNEMNEDLYEYINDMRKEIDNQLNNTF